MDRKLLFTLVLIGLLGGLFWILFQIFQPFLMALLWAGILVTVTYPLFDKLKNKLGGKATLASALMCLGLTLVVVLPLSFLLLVLVHDAKQGSEHITAYVKTLDLEQMKHLQGPLFENPISQQIRHWIEPYVNLEQLNLKELALQSGKKISQVLLKQSQGILGAFGSFTFTLILTELSMFFLFCDGARFLRFIRSLIPIEEDKKQVIFGRMREVVQATIFGTMGTALCQGAIGGVLMITLGLPSAVLWGVVMTLSSFLPLVGTSLVWVPASIYFLVQGSLLKAIIMIVGGLFISTVDNFIRPVLIRSVSSDGNQLNTLVLFMSVLGGLRVFGFLGIVLGPLVVVLFLTLLELLYAYMGYDLIQSESTEAA